MNSRFPPPGLLRSPPPADADLVDLRRLAGIARRQARTAGLCTLAGTALGIAWLATATPLYTSTATLLLNPLAEAPLTGAAAPAIAAGLLDSETGILRSEQVAADAFAAIDPAWLATAPSPAARLKQLLRPGLASPEARRQQLIDHLRAELTVERPDGAFLLNLAYTSPSPQHAAAVLAAVLDAYRADRQRRRAAAAASATAEADARIEDLRSRIAEASDAAAHLDPADADGIAAFADLRGRTGAYAAALGQLVLRRQELATGATVADSGLHLASPPSVPVFDSSPNAARTLLLSTLAGAMAGVGAGLMREAAERGFRTPGQVRRELGVPCLALLPVRPEHAVDTPFGPRTEALRAVKLSLDRGLPQGRPRRIGFAPVAAGDGATTTALSFAALLAAGGTTTLLLDADMRDRGLAEELDLTDHPGFSEVLEGRAVAPAESRSGLRILPAGADRTPAAEAISLDSPHVAEAMDRLAAPFELVVVDLPPLAASVDARALARHLDAVVIVARWRRTERSAVRALLAADRDLQRKVAGVILNRASPGLADLADDEAVLEDLG